MAFIEGKIDQKDVALIEEMKTVLPGELDVAIVRYLEKDLGSITIALPGKPNVAVAVGTLEGLHQRLTDPMLDEKTAELRSVGEDFPIGHLVGGRLVRDKVLRKSDVRMAAAKLMRILLSQTENTIDEPNTDIPPRLILTEEQLDSAAELTLPFGSDREAVSRQLLNEYRLAGRGLIITPTNSKDSPEELGFELPQRLLSILKALKYPESADILQQWIYNNIANPETCVSFLETLSQFTAFLDSNSLLQIWAPAAENGNGAANREIPIIPYQSLYNGVATAKNYLTQLGVDERFVTPLVRVEETILMRFGAALRSGIGEEISIPAADAITPPLDNTISRLSEWLKTDGSRLPPQVAATHTLKMLEQIGLGESADISRLIHQGINTDKLSQAQAYMLQREAIRMNLLKDPEGEITADLMRETLRLIEQRHYKDAGTPQIDFSRGQLIRPEINTLEITVLTGTMIFHKGHRDLLQRLIERNRFLGDRDETGKLIQRIILIAPLTNVENLEGYSKKPEEVGTSRERVGSVLLQIADLQPKDVYISTRLQQSPKVTGQNTVARINSMLAAFKTKITNDLQNAGMATWFNFDCLLAIGSDEIGFKEVVDKDGTRHRELKSKQPEKVRRDICADGLIVVGRRDYLVDTIENSDSIVRQTAIRQAILTPGTQKTSSTKAIAQLGLHGDSSYFLNTAVPYMRAHYGPKAIQDRAHLIKTRGYLESGEPPTIQNIAISTASEYREMLRQIGVI